MITICEACITLCTVLLIMFMQTTYNVFLKVSDGLFRPAYDIASANKEKQSKTSII